MLGARDRCDLLHILECSGPRMVGVGVSSIGRIASPDGPLLVMTVGLGAVATTFMAGVELVRRGYSKPIGSLTLMQMLDSELRVSEALPLASLSDLRFAAWDPIPDSGRVAAMRARVLDQKHIDCVSEFLEEIQPMSAVFDRAFVPQLDGPNVKPHQNRAELVVALREDIKLSLSKHQATRAVMIWCASTEVYEPACEVHRSIEAFESAISANDPSIAPSQLYAYAALMEGIPFVNAAPNVTIDVPAMVDLAEQQGVPICGKDLKTGQTLLKTVLAPALQSRMLGVEGWVSMNILGNRDGLVLDDPRCFRTKEKTKTELLGELLDSVTYPELYGHTKHLVRIDYYAPRGDAKEAWDSIDILGWLGYPMQIKINFLGRDSILAAPLILDLALLTDLAKRAGRRGVQDWLGFYFKCPQSRNGVVPNALHLQHERLREELLTLAKRYRATDGGA